jgi:DNA-binding NarL/FixJ family response regulator
MDSMRPIKVLLVDDSAVFARTAKCMVEESALGEYTLQVLWTASSGDEALLRNQRDQPDLVLMDLNMPGMCGIKATRQIKSSPHAPKVIMLSPCDDDELAQAAELAGADGHLGKHALGDQMPAVLMAVLHGDAP